MKRAQLSLDLMFAVTLVALTVLGLISLATHEVEGAQTFDASAKLKVFAIDIRDTVTKVYAAGEGFGVMKMVPFELENGDYVKVTLDGPSGELRVEAEIGGTKYTTVQKIPVSIASNTTVTLTPSNNEFWVVCGYNNTVGGVDVRLTESP